MSVNPYNCMSDIYCKLGITLVRIVYTLFDINVFNTQVALEHRLKSICSTYLHKHLCQFLDWEIYHYFNSAMNSGWSNKRLGGINVFKIKSLNWL